MADTLHLVDGSGFIFRAHYAMSEARGRSARQLSTKTGMPTTALYVFTSMLIKIHLEDKPTHFAVVFDAGGRSFRDEVYPEYKAGRKEPPDELQVQFPFFPKIVVAMCIPLLSVDGVEADDVIATLTRQARARDLDVVIHSSDKDLMQLVDDHVRMYDSLRNVTYDAARVTEKFGVPPAKVGDVLALMGDTSDNVPGVTGVGPGWAKKLLEQYGDLEGVLAHAGEVKGAVGKHLVDEAERARLSRRLVTLDDHVALPVGLEDLRRGGVDQEKLVPLFTELEFGTLLERMRTGTQAAPVEKAPPARVDLFSGEVRAILTRAELEEAAGQIRAAGALALHAGWQGSIAAEGTLIGIGLAWPGAPPAYVPLGHRLLGAPAQLREEEALAVLAPLLADPALPKTIHNCKAAIALCERRAIPLAGVASDPMLASYLVDPSRPSHECPELAQELIGATLAPDEELLGKGKSSRPLAETEVPVCARFAGARAEAALHLGRVLDPELDRLGLRRLYDEVELPLARVLAGMERVGVGVDVEVLTRLSERAGRELDRIEREVHDLVGHAVNLQSPKQLQDLLFGKLGLPVGRKTKTGPSTDAEVLEELATLHPVPGKILEHREIAKLKGTYLDALPRLVSPRDGRLRTSYNQAVAATGRISSSDPNLQNIPIRTELGREIRRAFVAPAGQRIVAADYSQIELRVLAHLSEDPLLLEAFSTGEDVHARTAREVFGVEPGQVTADMRRVAKAVNFGVIYGQSDFGLARALGIPRQQAKTYIDEYFARYQGVRRFMTKTIEDARAEGGVTTLLGRRRPLPDLRSRRFQDRSYAERIARNTPIQGTAADLLKVAMIRMQRRLDGDVRGARMVLTVHDELVFEVPEGDVERFVPIAREEMQGVFQLAVPLQVDVGSGANWMEAH